MPDRIGVFMLAALVLVAVPGPDVLYITARGMDQGRLAGLTSAFSAALGGLVLTLAAALGLSTILESSALAFSIVKYLGAAYLISALPPPALKFDAGPGAARSIVRLAKAQGTPVLRRSIPCQRWTPRGRLRKLFRSRFPKDIISHPINTCVIDCNAST